MMKKILSLITILAMMYQYPLLAQKRCGIEAEKAAIIAAYPDFANKLQEQKAALQYIAGNYEKNMRSVYSERTASSTCYVPVVFHIAIPLDSFNLIGGMAGVQQRVDSQIAVINRDFNRGNVDSTWIPTGWHSLYGNTGIHFALAHCDPNGHNTPGFEVRITDTLFTNGTYSDFTHAKYTDSGGLNAWDVTKYLNVWCINFSGFQGLLGITTPHSYTSAGMGHVPDNEEGICITYNTLGKRASPTDYYYNATGNPNEFDLGRTLTHELGHYFEIWHVWGDDGGTCAGDDGLADTPPQADYSNGNPFYTLPNGTITDPCIHNGTTDTTINVQPIGIACLSYLDYTDDAGMHLFTTQQAAAMASMVLLPSGTGQGPTSPAGYFGLVGESYSLTQNCNLLAYPDSAHVGINNIVANNGLNVYPNPTHGVFYVGYDHQVTTLNSISIVNVIGTEVLHINTEGNAADLHPIDLSQYAKGIYFVKCNFVSGTDIREILLQ